MNQLLTQSHESQLIRRAAQGDVDAFETLAEQHRGTLRSLALRMLRNADDAADAVQETLVKAFRGIKDFDPERPLRPWLCRICSNCCVDSVRSRRREPNSLSDREQLISDGSNLSNETEERFEQEAVFDAVKRLPGIYRQILLMRHVNQMDVIEIAEELKKPEGTVKSWLFRARALLKRDLQLALISPN